MDDLARWYGEQLDVDGRIARAADAELSNVFTRIASFDPEMADDERHIMEHRPTRVLREIDAKRQMLDDLRTDEHGMSSYSARFHCGAAQDDYGNRLGPDDFARRTHPCDCGRDERVYRRVRLLALPYADRPGYKETWRL